MKLLESNSLFIQIRINHLIFSSGAWWAKNVPNIASTLSILIPAYGGVKALSYAGKAMQATKLGALAKSKGITT